MGQCNAHLLGAFRLRSPFPTCPPHDPMETAGPPLPACSSAAVKATLNINRAAPGTAGMSITGLLIEGLSCLFKVKQ